MKFLTIFGVCILFFACFLSVHAQFGRPNLLQILQSLGMQQAVDALRAERLGQELTSAGAYTIFSPRKIELQIKDHYLQGHLNREVSTRLHIVEGRYTKRDLTNNLILTTMNLEEIRINVYAVGNNQVYTVNGVPIQSFDHMAFNGAVHTLQYVITPTLGNASEVLNVDIVGAQRFLQAADAAELLDELNADTSTLMVPGDDSLTEEILNDLLANPDQLERMVRNHILPDNVLYTAGMTVNELPTLLDGEILVFSRRSPGNSISVNGATIIRSDIPTTNGVIHVINAVRIPRPVDIAV